MAQKSGVPYIPVMQYFFLSKPMKRICCDKDSFLDLTLVRFLNLLLVSHVYCLVKA